MNSKTILGLFLICAMILLGTLVSALNAVQNTKLDNTTIDYTSYREIVVDSAGVVYQVKITNTGKEERYYEILPLSGAIRNIGTYRIDPSDKVILKPNQEQTVFLYITIEKSVSGRIEIPVRIKSGFAETTINLVARPFGPFNQPENTSKDGMGNVLITALKIVFGAMIIILILIGLFIVFRKIRKKKEDETEENLRPEFEEEIETYY